MSIQRADGYSLHIDECMVILLTNQQRLLRSKRNSVTVSLLKVELGMLLSSVSFVPRLPSLLLLCDAILGILRLGHWDLMIGLRLPRD